MDDVYESKDVPKPKKTHEPFTLVLFEHNYKIPEMIPPNGINLCMKNTDIQ